MFTVITAFKYTSSNLQIGYHQTYYSLAITKQNTTCTTISKYAKLRNG